MDKESINQIYSDDFKELKKFLNFFNRNKKTIIKISTIFFVLSIIYGFQKKKTWEGQFEIVLDSDTKSSSSNLLGNSLSAINLIGFNTGASSLDTEVGILKSPSVLMPIFDFVKISKEKTSPEINLNFTNWRKSLSVKLRDKTKILDIKYRDKDKNIIIPVLEKVTFAYQKYSGKNKKREFSLAKKYLENQISIYKLKSSNSLKQLQNYAMQQDLTIIDLYGRRTSSSISNNNTKEFQNLSLDNSQRSPIKTNNFIENLGVEEIRVNAANRIRNIDSQIKKIEALGEDPQQVEYFGSTIEALKNTGLPQKLSEIDEELTQLRSKYSEKDRSIIAILEKRKLLIDLLKKRSIGFLKSERIYQESIMEAASRPSGVILKYKELSRIANRDENTLIELENNLRVVNLEQARMEDPWELISKPTLKKRAISPKKGRIGLIGIILGLFFSSIFAFFKEQKSSLIYEEDTLESLLDLKILEKINILNGTLIKNNKEIFLNEILELSPKKFFSFIKVGSINLDESSKYLNIFKKDEIKYRIYDSLNNIKDIENTIIIMRIGKVSSSEIISLKERLIRKNINPMGILLFTDE